MNVWAATLYVAVKIMSSTKKLAYSSIFTALAVIVLFIGSVFQTLDLSCAAFASLIILVAFIELGKSWSFLIYLAVSVISILILPYKTAALIFVAFSGFYPIIKEPLNRIKPIWLSYLARLTAFNVFLAIFVFLAVQFFDLQEEFKGFTVVICILSNVTFVLFDYAIERIALYYVQRLKPLLFGKR